MNNRVILTATAFATLFTLGVNAFFGSVHAATLSSGDLIKGSGKAVYYFDGAKRRAFPNDKVYFSWYADFASVKTVSDAELAAIALGPNVTYRPGKWLVKVTTDPRTYAVDGGATLRWVTNENAASLLYGLDWAKKVQDVPDAFFVNYTTGANITTAADFSPLVVLAAYPTISVGAVAAPTTPAPTPTPEPTSPVVVAPAGVCAVPVAAQAEATAGATVVGTGTPASCTSAAVTAALQAGGNVTFNCGPSAHTIVLDAEVRLKNKVGPAKNGNRVVDGGGLVTLSGGGAHRILYQDACAQDLGWLNDRCNDSLEPRLVLQNIGLTGGRVASGSKGGAAVYVNGGSLKLVNAVFTNNVGPSTGPDVAGGAVYATHVKGPTYVSGSTFGKAGAGNEASNGGALGGLFASYDVTNSVFAHNKAVGVGQNPARSGTAGGGLGGAVYMDGNSMDLNLCGVTMEANESNEMGAGIFYVANDVQGHIKIDRTALRGNDSGSPDGPQPGVKKPDAYLQTTASNISIVDSTFTD